MTHPVEIAPAAQYKASDNPTLNLVDQVQGAGKDQGQTASLKEQSASAGHDFSQYLRPLADIAGAATSLAVKNLPTIVAEASGIPLPGIWGKGLALVAGLTAGGLMNNAVAGREWSDAEGHIRNAGSTALAAWGMAKIPVTAGEGIGAVALEGVRNYGKFAAMGAGYQGMNIGLGDRKADGSAYTFAEGFNSMSNAAFGTAVVLGGGSMLFGRAALWGQTNAARALLMTPAPFVSEESRRILDRYTSK